LEENLACFTIWFITVSVVLPFKLPQVGIKTAGLPLHRRVTFPFNPLASYFDGCEMAAHSG
jgi:hypothetical protein